MISTFLKTKKNINHEITRIFTGAQQQDLILGHSNIRKS